MASSKLSHTVLRFLYNIRDVWPLLHLHEIAFVSVNRVPKDGDQDCHQKASTRRPWMLSIAYFTAMEPSANFGGTYCYHCLSSPR